MEPINRKQFLFRIIIVCVILSFIKYMLIQFGNFKSLTSYLTMSVIIDLIGATFLAPSIIARLKSLNLTSIFVRISFVMVLFVSTFTSTKFYLFLVSLLNFQIPYYFNYFSYFGLITGGMFLYLIFARGLAVKQP